ncbi:MAG: hypothetical protein ACREQX_18790 [Candidatus Binataceae bacterium]
MRAVLYMGTLVAIRLNPLLRAFRERLRRSGKSRKLVVTACMRKLIVILNAMLKSELPFEENRFTTLGTAPS